jgi:hypothetical protein
MARAILSRIRAELQENPRPAVIAASIPVHKVLDAGGPLLGQAVFTKTHWFHEHAHWFHDPGETN